MLSILAPMGHIFMNAYLLLIIFIIVFFYLLELVTELLNLSRINNDIPSEFASYYDAEKYQKSQAYLKATTQFSIVQSTVSLVITLLFIFLGGFNTLDLWVRSFSFAPLITGLFYMGTLGFCLQFFTIPFSYYSTFVIEERFGFNKSTKALFFIDIFKTTVLSVVILAPILGFVLWFFERFDSSAWLVVWAGLTGFQLLLAYIAPTFIMPFFNKFEPLKDKELEAKVMAYAQKENFSLKGLYQMDGSKRSSKSNAFFTGFGANKRIVLFDTLIEKHSHEELLVILAHEMGHYKKKHIQQAIILSILTSGLMLYVLSLFLNSEPLFEAFSMEHVSVYASLIFFGLLFAPVEFVLSLVMHVLSRKNEFEADAYAIKTTGLTDAFITALKKLSVDNLSNLTPHRLKVFLEYSHPPILDRIKAIRLLQ